MPPPALTVLENGLTPKWSNDEWGGFSVFPGESSNLNPNSNFNVLEHTAAMGREKIIVPSRTSRSSGKEESFRMVLQPAMSPPRDMAVPLPSLPEPLMKPRKKLGPQESVLSPQKSRYPEKNNEGKYDFKCTAFCLSLPGFGKQKPVRSPKCEDSSIKKKMIKSSSFSNSTVSISTSLENFECGSWASATALAQENSRLYFDLPMEMIKFGSRGDGNVQTLSSGFFSDKDPGSLALRSVLKTRSSLSGRQQRGSAETSPQRRVRFSTKTSVSCPSSPGSCITPRLLKARDDFNAFLAAQNA